MTFNDISMEAPGGKMGIKISNIEINGSDPGSLVDTINASWLLMRRVAFYKW